MKSARINQQLHAYLNGNLSEAETKVFEEELMSNPELNHQVNKKRFKEKQSISRKESNNNKNPNRINWLAIVVILVSAFFIFQFLSKDKNDENVSEADPTQQYTAGYTDGSAAPPLAEGARGTISKRKTDVRTNSKIEEAAVFKTIAQHKSIAQKENKEVKSTGLEYIMLAKQLYAASDYPIGEELLYKDAKPIQNKNLFDGITAYVEGKDMKQAVLSFQKINRSKEREDYDLAKPFLAHAYFKLGEYQKAKPLFEHLSNNSEVKIVEDAEWFLVLSLLSDYRKEQDKVEALLSKMLKIENKHRHIKDAIYLKEDLEKIKSFNSH
ncbi:MAG: tetratricopeptide (TPR) repeat protein [Polaribacter sp.]|jgi:tetratricopeptide (TPR) repeat protein